MPTGSSPTVTGKTVELPHKGHSIPCIVHQSTKQKHNNGHGEESGAVSLLQISSLRPNVSNVFHSKRGPTKSSTDRQLKEGVHK
jgi:hypothetical protein